MDVEFNRQAEAPVRKAQETDIWQKGSWLSECVSLHYGHGKLTLVCECESFLNLKWVMVSKKINLTN